MVRMKPVPEPLFPKGRITMRETRREVIHEVSVDDGQRFQYSRGYVEPTRPQYSVEYPQSPPRRDNDTGRNDRHPDFSQFYDGPNEYMTEEYEPTYARELENRREYSRKPMEGFSRNIDGTSEYMTEQSYARPTGNRSRQNDDRENTNPSYLRLHGSRNEYMTHDRTKQSYENLKRKEKRVPLQRRQINEYMTDPREVSMEIARDSSFPSEQIIHEMQEQEDDLPALYTRRVDASDHRMMDRSESVRDGTKRKMIYRNHEMPETRNNYRESGWNDAGSSVAGPSRLTGGTPRFGIKSFARRSIGRRHRPGVKALKEIRRLQKSTCNLIPKLPFQRVIREVVTELYPDCEYRFTVESCEALHVAAEDLITRMFEEANTCAIHAKRVTVMPSDIRLVRKVQHW
nr:Histone core domain containing protein [Haemonchus contortus]